FYGRCPNPQFLKKLSKLFCFWEDNLALAKFQSPTDTTLNHNLKYFFGIKHNKTFLPYNPHKQREQTAACYLLSLNYY
ncbi:MAG: hypothetical protein ACLRQ1_05205, partial [Ruminococcus sp.]|uniref:hypothetical protein n=1 Tax=Ruminococcus sp. TaxID=41978 RepID=UPI003990BEDF